MFFESIKGDDIDSIIEKYYTKDSLYIFKKDNKFRRMIIHIIENQIFKRTMYIIIIISSFLSFAYSFKERVCEYYKIHKYYNEIEKCLQNYKSEIHRDNIITKIFYIINILFTIEMLMKIIAKGFILHKYAYLRNGWNIIDFIICIYQWLKLKYDDWGNLCVFRCIKFIGIVKDISLLSGLRKLIDSIIISLPTLGNVILFLLFIVLLFGILGIQLFSGALYNRCREFPIKINDNYNNTGIPYYQSIPVSDKICSIENYTGTFQCPKNSYCVNFYAIIDYFGLENITMKSFKKEDEGLQKNIWLYFGCFNFDNVFDSLINTFSFMTLQNWSKDITRLLDGCSKTSTLVYFNSIVIIGGFFIIKLILSAQYDAMKKVINDEIDLKLFQLNEQKKKTDIFFFNKEDRLDLFQKKKDNTFRDISSYGSNMGLLNSPRKHRIINFVDENKPISKKGSSKGESKFLKIQSSSPMKNNLEDNGNSSNNLRANISLNNNQVAVNTHFNNIKKVMNKRSSVSYNSNKNLSKKSNNISNSESKSNNNDSFDKSSLKLLSNVKKKLVNKIKYMVLEEYSNTIQYKIFNFLIYFVITLNIIFMCLMKYPMSKNLENIINIINIICTSIFILEIIFKIIVLGFKSWLKNIFNIVDLVIAVLGLFEIIYVKFSEDETDNANSSISSLRAIRYIKLLRFTKKGGIYQRFIKFFLISLKDLFYYCILLVFFIVIFAIAGIELFANAIFIYDKKDEYNYIYNTINPPRENFNNVQNALVTVFIIFVGDNWPETLYEYEKIYKTSSRFYFLGTIIFGNIMLLNLFLSILINNYQRNDGIILFDKEDKNEILNTSNQLEEEIKGFWTKVSDWIKKFLDCCIKEQFPSSKRTSKRKGIIGVGINFGEAFTKKIEDMKDIIKIERTSLMLFSPENKFRLFCSKIIQGNKWFKYFILGNIVISLIIMALDSPCEQDMRIKKLILTIDAISTFIFLLEAVFKSISFGFLFNGENSYLRYEYNIIDFLSLVLSIIYLIFSAKSTLDKESLLDSGKGIQILRVIKLLRLVRIIKVIELSKSLQAALRAYYKSCIQMLKLILIECLIILIFDIIGVNYFRGRFSRCEFSNIPNEYMKLVITKWDCMDYGGDWITPYPNLDNVKSGFILFFEMMTTEGWVKYMYIAMDANKIDFQPIRDKSFRWALFFVLYMVFSFFFVFNIAIVILSDNFNKEKEKIENHHFKLPIQNEFFKIFKTLYKVEIPKKRLRSDKITKVLINILDSIYFEVVIIVCIVANLFILTMNYPGQSETSMLFFSDLNNIISYIFVLEAVLKIYVYRWNYFRNGWNLIDFIVVCEFITTITLKNYLSFLKDELETTIFKILRVGRVLKLLRSIKSLRKILNLFFNSIPGVFNVLILYFIMIFIYGIIGMNLFYDLKYQNIINENWNFKNFINSIITLIRATSGGGWNTIMHESTIERDGINDCKYKSEMTLEELYKENIGCGSFLGFPFFISFIILAMIMFIEFFSAVISCAMDDTYAMNLDEMKTGDINKFKNKWAAIDKKCTGFMNVDKLQKFIYKIGHPLGISSMKISDFIRVCSLLKIYTYTYENKQYVFFYDVLIELTKYYLLHKTVEDEYNNDKVFYNNIEEIIEYKTESLIKYMQSINEMQEDHFCQILNPYYLHKKYSDCYRINEINKNNNLFNLNKKMTVNYTWAIQKLSTFTKCYKCMRKKTIKIIEEEEFRTDITDYAIAYSRRIMVDIHNSNLKYKFPMNRMEIHEMESSTIREENSNSKNNSKSDSSNDSFSYSSSSSSYSNSKEEKE